MKKIVLIIALCLLGFNDATAQQEESQDFKTIFGDIFEINVGGYGGFQIKITEFDNQFGILVGGRGGVTFNKQFTVGLAGYGLASFPSVEYTDTDGKISKDDIAFGYGGFYFEYVHNPNDIIHFSGNTFVGFGGATLFDESWIDMNSEDNSYIEKNDVWASYLIFEPSAAIEINFSSFFTIALEAGYRFVTKTNSSEAFERTEDLKNLNPSGFASSITFKFGSF